MCNYKENDNQMIIFASDNCLKALVQSSRWHADGTFKCAVMDFQQVYIIHGLYRGHMIPFVYVLLTTKLEKWYKNSFKSSKMRLGVQYDDFMTDFVDKLKA